VTFGLGVPLRQDNHSPTGPPAVSFAAGDKQPRPRGVVYFRGRLNCTRPCQYAVLKMKVLDRRQRKESVALPHRFVRMLGKQVFGVVTIDVVANEICAPFKLADISVFVSLREMALARPDPLT
jgi:hypothetical protein